MSEFFSNNDSREDRKSITIDESLKPIDRIKPESQHHGMVLSKLNKMLKTSEDKMNAFYERWGVAEKKMQAYIDLSDAEEIMKEDNDAGKAPKIISIVVPYSYSTISTIVTYLIHTFTGQKPMFSVSPYKAECIDAARNMETILQYQADHSRLIKQFYQWFMDGEIYGVGIMKTLWEEDEQYRTKWKDQVIESPMQGLIGSEQYNITERVRVREKAVVYQGNKLETIDPYRFFPDPSVPMEEVNKKGQFVFWRDFVSKQSLKDKENKGIYKYVAHAGNQSAEIGNAEESFRNCRTFGDSFPGKNEDNLSERTEQHVQVDQGTVDIIPFDWGLGESKEVEKWLFTMLNRNQIVQAVPFECDHAMHPVSVIEPYTIGYGFGQLGMVDLLGGVQDALSWFVNSHIYNVRASLNNMFICDPSKIEMQDLKNPSPGKIIRTKRAAVGLRVGDYFQQLQVTDVTRNHMNDLGDFMKMGDTLSAITDNVRGVQDAGGRKTATEVRTAGEAAASRLASHARLISAQGIVDITEQMSLNIQQFQTMDFYLRITGQDGQQAPLNIEPEMLNGDFYYPVNDGTLPIDRIASLDIWKEILMGVAQDPELRQNFSLPKIFEWVAELGGARNIENFKVQMNPQSPEAIQQQVQAGNIVPTGETGI